MAQSRGDFSQTSDFNRDLPVPHRTLPEEVIDLALRCWRPLLWVFLISGAAGYGFGFGVPPALTIAGIAGYLIISCVVHVKFRLYSPFVVIPQRAYVDVSSRRKARAIEIRNRWAQIAVNAHLAPSVQILRHRGPYLRAIQETPEGMTFYVSVAEGDSAIRLVDSAPNLASALKVNQLLSAENNQLVVKFVIPARDALKETVSLASVRYGNVANPHLAESLRETPANSVYLGVTSLSRAVTIPLERAQHYAFQGQSRSGKSVALYSFLSQIRSIPTVQITGIDPTGALPSAHDTIPWVLGGESGISPADVSAWLDNIENILNQRLVALRQAQYRDQFEFDDQQFPLLLVVFEEFPGVLRGLKMAEAGVKPAERVSDRLKAIYGRLLMEAAKINIRTVTIAQRADAEFLGGAERAQIGCRVTFKVDNQDAVKMFHDDVSGHDWETLRNALPGVGIIEQLGQRQVMFRAFNMDFVEYRNIAGPQPELVVAGTDDTET